MNKKSQRKCVQLAHRLLFNGTHALQNWKSSMMWSVWCNCGCSSVSSSAYYFFILIFETQWKFSRILHYTLHINVFTWNFLIVTARYDEPTRDDDWIICDKKLKNFRKVRDANNAHFTCLLTDDVLNHKRYSYS